MKIDIIDATPQNAELISNIVLRALDIESNPTPEMIHSCSQNNMLYSWEHTRLASIDGEIVGGLISYGGANYAEMRLQTWKHFWELPTETLDAIPLECGVEEYYLDSMVLAPQSRGLGIGKILIADALELARQKGYTLATLLVSLEKPALMEYYKQIGFFPMGRLRFMGQEHQKMAISIVANL